MNGVRQAIYLPKVGVNVWRYKKAGRAGMPDPSFNPRLGHSSNGMRTFLEMAGPRFGSCATRQKRQNLHAVPLRFAFADSWNQ